MITDQEKLAYLAKHQVPVLLDNIVNSLLSEMPESPAEFFTQLDPTTVSQRTTQPAAASAVPEPKKKPSFGGEEGGAKKKKPSFGPSFSEADEGGATGGTATGDRRLSFNGSVRFGDTDDNEGSHTKKPANKMSKEEVGKIKSFRKEFFNSYLNEDWGSSHVRCHHIGSIALSLSYLIKGSRNKDPSERVSMEDVFFRARLPLYYTSNSGITLAELYDIAVKFTERDPRFQKKTDVNLVHFDTRLYDGEVDTMSQASGDRGPCVSLPTFRHSMERDSRDDRRVRVFNFDPFIAEQASLALQDEDEEDGGVVRAKRKNRGAYAVFTEFNAFKHSVKLSECFIGEEEIQTKFKEVLLTAMYKSCCALDAFSKRPRGYIEFRGDAENFENVELDQDDEVDTHWSCRHCIDDALLEAVPSGAKGTSLNDVANHISPHIVAVAWGIHLIQGSRMQVGVDIGDLLGVNQLPLHVMMGDQMPIQQVQAYAQEYLERRGKADSIAFSLHELSTLDGAEDSPPSLSVMDLENYLVGIMGVNKNPAEPECVMLLNFDVNMAHNVLGLEQGSIPSHWAVVVSYDESQQLVRVGDITPKKFCKHWHLPLTRLHTALTGKGFLLASRLTGGTPPTLSNVTIPRPLSATTRQASGKTSQPTSLGDPLQTFEFPANIFCITIVALALSRMNLPTSVEDVIHKSGVDVSFLLSDHVSMQDIRRITSYVAKTASLPVSLTYEHVEKDATTGNMKISLQQFCSMLEEYGSNAAQCCVILNYSSEQVHSVQHFHNNNGGDYAIVLSYNPSNQTVVCCDVNPKKFYRTWTAPADVIYNAMQEDDYASKRARGYLVVHNRPAPASQGRQYDIRRMKNRHPVKSPTSPHISALAFALSEMGHVCSSEDVFYTAYDQMIQSGSYRPDLFALGTLKPRLTLPDAVEIARSFMRAVGNLNKPVSLRVSNKSNPITTAELEQELNSTVNGLHVVIMIYSSTQLHKTKGSVGAALVKSYNRSTKVVTMADVDTTKYGFNWDCDLQTLREAITSDEGEKRGLIRVGSM